jgi:hypothetical protein
MFMRKKTWENIYFNVKIQMCFSSKRFATFGKSQKQKKKKHCSNIESTKVKIQAFKTQRLQLWEIMNNIIFYLIGCQ